jgi:hypothetical protein
MLCQCIQGNTASKYHVNCSNALSFPLYNTSTGLDEVTVEETAFILLSSIVILCNNFSYRAQTIF